MPKKFKAHKLYVSVLRSSQNTVAAVDIRAAKAAVIVKGNAIPLQAWNGPEGSRKLRFPDFFDNGTGCCQPYAPAAFTPRKYS
jgi:hypothetical protein